MDREGLGNCSMKRIGQRPARLGSLAVTRRMLCRPSSTTGFCWGVGSWTTRTGPLPVWGRPSHSEARDLRRLAM